LLDKETDNKLILEVCLFFIL